MPVLVSHTDSELLFKTDLSSPLIMYSHVWISPWCADGLMKAKNWLKKRNVIDKRLEGNADGESVIHWQYFDNNLWSLIFVVKSGTLRELQPIEHSASLTELGL